MEKNLKMLIEIFCQKLIVYNVNLAFLDHLKSKILLADIERHPFSKCLDPVLLIFLSSPWSDDMDIEVIEIFQNNHLGGTDQKKFIWTS